MKKQLIVTSNTTTPKYGLPKAPTPPESKEFVKMSAKSARLLASFDTAAQNLGWEACAELTAQQHKQSASRTHQRKRTALILRIIELEQRAQAHTESDK